MIDAKSGPPRLGQPMTRTGFLAAIERIERELPVVSWRVGDLHVWPLIRIHLYAANLDSTLGPVGLERGLTHNARALVSGLRRWMGAAVRDWRGNVRPTRAADAVFLAYSIGRQPIVAGRSANPLLQPYVDLLARAGRTSVVWEMAPSGEYNIPRSTPSAYIQPLLYAARLWSLSAPEPRPHEIALDGYEDFVVATRRAGLVNRYQSLRALGKDVAFVSRVRGIFRSWLQRTGARYGFVADYALPNLAFCQACGDLGIESVEIQHGLQGEGHPVYARWHAVPAGGYRMRPQYYWCWDEGSAAAVNRWAISRGLPGAVIGGNPWRAQWHTLNEATGATHRELEALRAQARARVHVLVTLDPTGDVVPPVLADALRRAPQDWCAWVRLHPVNQTERLPEAQRLLRDVTCVRVPLTVTSCVPLHALLAYVDVHVTACWSTVIGEAAEEGVASAACHARAREIFPELVADGRLLVADSADGIHAAVERQATRRARPAFRPGVDAAGALNRVLHRELAPEAVAAAASSR